MKRYLAIDIGASSGRHIVGWSEAGQLRTREVYRFPNGMRNQDGHLVWDTVALLSEVKRGIERAREAFPGEICSLSIDTWGVDYVLLCGDREILPCYAYRDNRTEDAIEAVHALIPFSILYRRTGCQFQPFTSIYQLYDDLRRGRLAEATDILMLPEYLMYQLTGTKAREFTNATTTGLVSAASGEFDKTILQTLGLPERLFPKLQTPGTILGSYEGIRVVLCATHDTASAVEGIPMDGNAPYISSGTWSLLGIKTEKPLTDAASEAANFSNEGGVGYNRYQKNLMGMWPVNRLQGELCPDTPIPLLAAEAEASCFDDTVDVDDTAFLAPDSMKEAFDAALDRRPRSRGDYFRCAYRSLALGYGRALEALERNTGTVCDSLYIVGGGAKNAFLNRITGELTGKRVIALPIEATALGNLKIQMRFA